MNYNAKNESNSNYNTGKPPVMDNTNAANNITTVNTTSTVDNIDKNKKRFAIVYSFSLANLLIKKGFIVKGIKRNYKLNNKEIVFYFDYSEAIESVIQYYCNCQNSQNSNELNN